MKKQKIKQATQMYSKTFSIYRETDYISHCRLNWEDVCKIVANDDVVLFEKKLQELSIIFRLLYKDLWVEDVLSYFYNCSQHCEMREQLNQFPDFITTLKKHYVSILNDFKKQVECNVDLDVMYCVLGDQIVYFTIDTDNKEKIDKWKHRWKDVEFKIVYFPPGF